MPRSQAARRRESEEPIRAVASAKIINLEDFVTTAQASEITGLNVATLARYAQQGRLPGRLVGHTWLLDRASVEAYAETWHKPGPKGPRKKTDEG